MKILIGQELELPLSPEQNKFAKFKVTNFSFYGDYAAFDSITEIPFNASLKEKIKWLFTKKPILLKREQVGVKLIKENICRG